MGVERAEEANGCGPAERMGKAEWVVGGVAEAVGRAPARRASIAVAFGLIGLLPLGFGAAAVIFAGVVVATALVAALALRQIGGQTGDVIGAMQKLAELAGWGVTVYLFA